MRTFKFCFVIGLVFLLTNCKKEKEEQYEFQKYNFQLNYIFENFTDFDIIPVQIPLDDRSAFRFSINYIDINDDDDDDDFYVSENYYAINDFLITKSFSISHETLSDDHFEIAILEDDYILMNDSIKIAAVLNKTEEINSHLKWSQLNDKDMIFLSCYYDYENYVYILNEDTPINGTNLNINGNINSKFIGVRKKIDNQYFYGWIQFTIENHERLTFEQFSFYK